MPSMTSYKHQDQMSQEALAGPVDHVDNVGQKCGGGVSQTEDGSGIVDAQEHVVKFECKTANVQQKPEDADDV